MRYAITQSYNFGEKKSVLEKRAQELYLIIFVLLKLGHVEQVFGDLGTAVCSPRSIMDNMTSNLPAGSWKWQRDSEMSWHRCSLPSAPAATWHWWAARAGTPFAAQSCQANTDRHLQCDRVQEDGPASPHRQRHVPSDSATGKVLWEN